ncbi:exosome complex component RRP43-like [Euwallacea similis]|uniref:exosome complex component RRP43-like n=1 Tax=Euwallacea similis TaxID=1736056 RepID=UPI00344D002C
MAEEYRALYPLKYYRDHISQDFRTDGRQFLDFRPIIINTRSISTADGSAIVKIGKTTVVCGIKAELCRPKPHTSNEGFLVSNLELPPSCSPKFRSGPPSNQVQILRKLIADIIESSRCVDLKELCILKGKLAWCLYVDFTCLDYDGCVVDACLIALTACLKTVTLPHVDYDPALDIKQVNLEHRIPITVHCSLVATTFAIYDDKIILVDPSIEEEDLGSGTVTIVVKEDELCCVHKPGGTPLSEEDLLKLIEKSKKRGSSVRELINAAVKNTT